MTNVADIEAFIQEAELNTDNKYLAAFDIPARQRDLVMRDLRFMGITAGSMFHRIYGICEEIKEQNFEL